MPRHYYNENEPYAAQWLRNLIAAGHIPEGVVDTRSIVDVRPADLEGFTQAHFFAGIGGWPLAARLAGWPVDRPLWTGSCPCQPFSSAGKGRGFADERHLWPVWFNLIRECRPAIVAGEQVPAAIPKGWLDLVFDDLEGARYACGAIIAPAAGVGAPHIRDRIWWVAADADGGGEHGQSVHAEMAATPESVADADCAPRGRNARHAIAGAGGQTIRERTAQPGRCDTIVADANQPGSQERRQSQLLVQREATIGGDWWQLEPGMGLVAHGVPARVGRLRAYGNAIVPQVAARFLMAVM